MQSLRNLHMFEAGDREGSERLLQHIVIIKIHRPLKWQ